MKPRILSVDPRNPEPDVIAEAAAALLAGGLVAFPTETVYGLGANALDAQAVSGIFAAKGRPQTNPLIVHVDSIERARALAASWPEAADALARAFWPGPLTLVVPRGPEIPDTVTAGLDTFGVRLPDHPVARALIAAADRPLAAPSANRYTQVSPTSAAHVADSLGDRVELILDGGSTEVGIESTVVRIEASGVTLLRPGQISAEQIAAVAGPVTRVIDDIPDEIARSSPGMSARHYAPRARVVLETWQDGPASPRRGALLYDSKTAPSAHFVVQMPQNPSDYARCLYATFWEADKALCEELVVELPPTAGEWEAVHDRLRRAQTSG